MCAVKLPKLKDATTDEVAVKLAPNRFRITRAATMTEKNARPRLESAMEQGSLRNPTHSAITKGKVLVSPLSALDRAPKSKDSTTNEIVTKLAPNRFRHPRAATTMEKKTRPPAESAMETGSFQRLNRAAKTNGNVLVPPSTAFDRALPPKKRIFKRKTIAKTRRTIGGAVIQKKVITLVRIITMPIQATSAKRKN